MNTHPRRFFTALTATLFWLFLSANAAVSFTESEDSPFQTSVDTYAHDLADPMPVPFDGSPFQTTFPEGAKLLRGSLDAGDVDGYEFWFSSDDLVLGALFQDGAGERDDTSLGIFTGGAGPALAIDDDGGSGFLSRFSYTVATSGTHQIGVTGFGDDAFDGTHQEAEAGLAPYVLVVAATPDPPALVELESNDSFSSATLLPAVGGVLGATLDAQDVDFFSIDLEAGDRLAISVFDLQDAGFVSAGGERNDTIVGVFDPLGSLAAGGGNDDGGPGRMGNLLFTATSDGTWAIAVSGFGDDSFSGDHSEEVFDYLLVVARERACPNVPPLISNVVASTPNVYEVAELQGGDFYYTDRTNPSSHVIVDVPTAYQCSEWIKTANNDKNVTDPNHLSFSLAEDASVFVAYDSRATGEPAWLSAGFTPTGDVVDLRDSDASQEFDVLRRDFPAGTVVLGGNAAPGAGSHYSVFARPLPLADASQSLEIPTDATAVQLTISGVSINVVGAPGQTSADFAAAIASAVNADPTLAAARIFGLASGAVFVTTGVIDSSTITTALPVPMLSLWGFALLESLVMAFGYWTARGMRSSL